MSERYLLGRYLPTEGQQASTACRPKTHRAPPTAHFIRITGKLQGQPQGGFCILPVTIAPKALGGGPTSR